MTVVFNRTRNANDILTGFRMPEEMAYRVEPVSRTRSIKVATLKTLHRKLRALPAI
jgi:hypothetical protein